MRIHGKGYASPGCRIGLISGSCYNSMFPPVIPTPLLNQPILDASRPDTCKFRPA